MDPVWLGSPHPTPSFRNAAVRAIHSLRRRTDPAIALPLAALAAYLVVATLRGHELSNAMFGYADGPESAYLGAGLLNSHTRLPLHTEIVVGLIEGALLRMPAAHALIQVLGPLLNAAAVAVLCLAVRRLGGAWWLSAATGLALGPIALWAALYPTAHVYTLLCLSVASLTVIALLRHRLRRWHALLAGGLFGSAVLSDPSFVLEGLMPLSAIVVFSGVQRDRRVLRLGALVFAATLVTIGAGAAMMSAAGVQSVFELKPGVTTYNTMGSSVNTIVHALSAIAAGSFFGADPAPPLGAVTSLLGAAIALVAPAALLMQVRRGVADTARTAYLLFWTIADIAVIVAFVVLGYGGPPQQGHFLIPCLFSAVATFPFLFAPQLRLAGGAMAAVFIVIQAFAVMTLPGATLAAGDLPEDAHILAAIRAQGLTRGYAEYWLSHPITWLSEEKVHVYPVEQPNCDDGVRLCPYLYSSDTWYRPTAGPTFLIVTKDNHCVVSAPASVGTPVRVVSIDREASLYVYDHDIAAHFARTFVRLC